MQVKISQAIPMIQAYLKANLVPMIHGSPGIGKSQIVHQIAEQFNLKVIDLRLSQCDPTDLAGFPQIDAARQKAGYMPMETFPLEGEALPEGYNGWLLFLDEANSAMPAVQAAAYKIILDRMVGQHRLHKRCAIVAAGNKETDGAIVNPLSTALQSRLVHIDLMVDVEDWLHWATQNGVHHFITDYVRFKPGNLYNFSADHTDHTYASPRTWEFANRLLLQESVKSPLIRPLLAGTVGEGVAHEFVGFTEIYDRLPKLADIEMAPDTIAVPDEPSILFALTGSISNHAKDDNFSQFIKYIKRLPVEFQVVCLKETVRRNKAMLAHPAVQKWTADSAATLF